MSIIRPIAALGHQLLISNCHSQFKTVLMLLEYDCRTTIIVALHAHCMPKEISYFLKINLRTVQRVAKTFGDDPSISL